MSTSQNIQTPNLGKIFIEEKLRHGDGSITLNYSLDGVALEECAKEIGKKSKELTEEEIHSFVIKNISHALKGINGWRTEKNTLIKKEIPLE
jgi:hypothetical protein